MKASRIIATAVAATVAMASKAGMITNEQQEQAAGKAALHLIMETQPELWAAYQEEVFGAIQMA